MSSFCCCVLQPLNTQSSWRRETIPSADLKPVKGGPASTHLLSTDCVPGTVLHVGENEGKKVPAIKEFHLGGSREEVKGNK